MSDAEGEFWGLSDDLVVEVGRLTIMGTTLEEMVYKIAGDVGLGWLPAGDGGQRRSRDLPATDIAGRVRKRMLVPDPLLVELDRSKVAAWCLDVVTALQQRHEVVHSMHYLRPSKDDPERWEHVRRPNRGPRKRPRREVDVTVADTREVRELLERRVSEAFKLWIAMSDDPTPEALDMWARPGADAER
ncbi:hypothetical protein PX701_13900 [Agromyces sp. H3Y2-19a]|uniref:hypothetical protein n=1 Tax=Agromyces chromiiresistens TaxID=3030835 RepID=UPI0023B89D1B|nr:hypothetical protein [Agromyces chromiiresistens]MDF0514720.1 hypothetical protein [Agromyces chromiiresistens]